MAQQNRTRYAVLGMLAYKPMSGYDIKKMIDNSIAFFWNENYGHIYPILGKLASEGLVKLQSKPAKGGGRPGRKVYEITKEGLKVITEWVGQPHAEEYFRIEVLLKLFFGMLVTRETSIAAVEREKKMALQALEEFRKIREKEPKAKSNDINFPLLTLSYGEKHYRAVVDWCDEALKLLMKGQTGRKK